MRRSKWEKGGGNSDLFNIQDLLGAQEPITHIGKKKGTIGPFQSEMNTVCQQEQCSTNVMVTEVTVLVRVANKFGVLNKDSSNRFQIKATLTRVSVFYCGQAAVAPTECTWENTA